MQEQLQRLYWLAHRARIAAFDDLFVVRYQVLQVQCVVNCVVNCVVKCVVKCVVICVVKCVIKRGVKCGVTRVS